MSLRPASRRLAVRACALAVVAALGLTGVTTAHAEDLMAVYRQAVQADPIVKQAEAQNRIGHEGMVQSRAVLLPQIGGSVSYGYSHGTHVDSTIQTPNGPVLDNNFNYTGGSSRTESVGLQQVLFDLGKFAQLKASKANAASSQAQYTAAEQDLILRVAQAYFTVLTDEQNVTFAQANEKALQKQLDQAQAKYHVGFAPITDVVDAKAQHETAVAQVITAENAVFNDRQALAQITGAPVKSLDPLSDTLPMQAPQPDNMESWVQVALASNPSLQAQRDLVQSAQSNVTVARAGHLPTLNASVSYARNPAWGGAGLPSNVRANSRDQGTTVGIVLDVPLFSGGATQSGVREAIARRDQAHDVLEQDRRTVISNTRSAFNAIKAGISSVKAQKAAVESAKIALDGTEAGYKIGTQTIVNLLIAQENYFQAQSAYSQARHALVVNQLNLKFAAGTLSVQDLAAVNALLQK
jgi:outer membrane protein